MLFINYGITCRKSYCSVFAASDADSATDKNGLYATDTVFKPFEYTDDDGNFVGIDVDVLDAIAKDQGFEYELKSLGWGRFHRSLPGWTG